MFLRHLQTGDPINSLQDRVSASHKQVVEQFHVHRIIFDHENNLPTSTALLLPLSRLSQVRMNIVRRHWIVFKPIPSTVHAVSDNPITGDKIDVDKTLFFDPLRKSLNSVGAEAQFTKRN